MLPYFGCAQDTHQTAPSCLISRVCCCQLLSVVQEFLFFFFGHPPFQCFGQSLSLSLDFEDFDCSVGGAGCEPSPVVVEDSIVLRKKGERDRVSCTVAHTHTHTSPTDCLRCCNKESW